VGEDSEEHRQIDTGYAGVRCNEFSKPIDPRRLGKEVCDYLGDDSVIVMDGGDIHAHVRLCITPIRHAAT